MNTVRLWVLAALGCVATLGFAQQTNSNSLWKVSGYIQAQYQYGQQDASLKVGADNEKADKSFDRFGIRRGRLKVVYNKGLASGTFQIDLTEKGVGLKDAYLTVKDPWKGSNALQAGVFNRPFGTEIAYSSAQRESPERSLLFQTLFPNERDLGAMLVLQAPNTSDWHWLKLEAGLFAGNGIKPETDSRKDFIGHLSANKTLNKQFSFGLGVSYYNGGVYQGTSNVYRMNGSRFELNDAADSQGKYAKREYAGIDGKLNLHTALGLTKIHAEYLFGTQPGTKTSSKSPNAATLPTSDTYLRNFGGWYVMLAQDLASWKLTAVAKYENYDPNTEIAKDEVGEGGSDKGDIAYSTLGLGLVWKAAANVRLQAWYDWVTNETTTHLKGYADDRKDNVFTLRLQYIF